MMANRYDRLLKEYPEYITKEQLYQICNVSKKTALYYLESGLLPAIDNGKQTRRFKIAIVDVVPFLKARDKNLDDYGATPGWYRGNGGYRKNSTHHLVRVRRGKKTQARLSRWLNDYPDLLKPGDVSKVTEYTQATVHDWCSPGKLHHFCIRKAYLIPKLSLLIL